MYLALALILTLVALLVENGILLKNPETRLVSRFQKNLLQKEAELDADLQHISQLSKNPGFTFNYLSDLSPFNEKMESNGKGYLIYRHGKLFYWSDRSISFRDNLPLSTEHNTPAVHFQNGFYLTRSLGSDSLTIIGLILIKYDFPHENQFLVNEFHQDLKLPASFDLLMAGSKNGIPIYNIDRENVFNILPRGKILCPATQLYIPGILYMAGLIFFILFFRIIISEINPAIGSRMLYMAGFLFFLYWIHILFRFPAVFYNLDFFSPAQFAYSF